MYFFSPHIEKIIFIGIWTDFFYYKVIISQ